MDHRKKSALLALVFALSVAGCRKRPASGDLSALGVSAMVPEGWEQRNGVFPFWASAHESVGASFPSISIEKEDPALDSRTVMNNLSDDRKIYEGDSSFTATLVSTSSISGLPAWTYSITFLDNSDRIVSLPKKFTGPQDVPTKKTYVFIRSGHQSYRIVYSAPVSLYLKYRPVFDQWMGALRFAP